MERDYEVVKELEKYMAVEKIGLARFLKFYRSIFAIVTDFIIPALLVFIGSFIDWDSLTSQQSVIYSITGICIVLIQIALGIVNFNWSPNLDRFVGLSGLKISLMEVNKQAIAHKNAAIAYGHIAASLSIPLKLLKENSDSMTPEVLFDEVVPNLIKSVYGRTEVQRFLGGGPVTPQFCVSLYKKTLEDEVKYERVCGYFSESYKQIRSGYEDTYPIEDSRVWSLSSPLGSVKEHSEIYFVPKLYEESPRSSREYDEQLYKNSMFLRSHLHFEEGNVKQDLDFENFPAYVLILTSGKEGVFTKELIGPSKKVFLESFRELLDLLMVNSYHNIETE